MTLIRDLKDLIEEFYKLELIVKTNDSKNIANSNSQNNSNSLVDNFKAAKESLNVTNTSPASSIGLNSTSAFINHHANRFKSKILQNSSANHATISSETQDTLSSKRQKNSSSWLKNTTSLWNSSKNNLIILANAAAIELYFLCIEDESDAEKLCSKCSEKFFINLSLGETILQAPLIASCIQVLSRLALNYPSLSKTSVKHLTDFLTEPSPVLLKQYKHIIEKLTIKSSMATNVNSNVTKSSPVNSQSNVILYNGINKSTDFSSQINGQFQSKTLSSNLHAKIPGLDMANNQNLYNNTRSLSRSQTLVHKRINASYSKSTRIFEFLRDLTIECLCL
jgi:hypothetical protein